MEEKTLYLFRKFPSIDALTVVRQFDVDFSYAVKILETLEKTGKIKMNFEGKHKGRFTSNIF